MASLHRDLPVVPPTKQATKAEDSPNLVFSSAKPKVFKKDRTPEKYLANSLCFHFISRISIQYCTCTKHARGKQASHGFGLCSPSSSSSHSLPLSEWPLLLSSPPRLSRFVCIGLPLPTPPSPAFTSLFCKSPPLLTPPCFP